MHVTIAKRGKINACDRDVIGFGFAPDCLIELVTRFLTNHRAK